MKKVSLSAFVAILAIGTALAVNAKSFTSRVIDGCFEVITVVQSASDATAANLAALPCANAQSLVVSDQYVKTASNPLLEADPCPTEDVVFCCARLVEIQPSESDYATAPVATIPGTSGQKFRILPQDIECKVTQ